MAVSGTQGAYEKAIEFYQAGKLDEAQAMCLGILAAEPRNASVKNLTGAIALARGELDIAADLFGEAAKLAPDVADFHANRGHALQAAGRLDEAVKCYDAALKRNPKNAETLVRRGATLHRASKLSEAAASFTEALALRPELTEAWHLRGTIHAAHGRHADALADYDRAIALEPDAAEVHSSRADALEALDRRPEAVLAIQRVISLTPDFPLARERYFGLALSETNDSTELDTLAEALARDNARADAANLRADRWIRSFRLLHDLEQTAHLLSRGFTLPGLRAAHDALAAAYTRRTEAGDGGPITLTDTEVNTIAAFRETVIRHPSPKLSGPTLNPVKNWTAIEDEYFSVKPELVVIDDLLSPEALAQLRDFALLSTIWRREYENHYLGAFSQQGFVAPLHIQIGKELQQKMPRIFGSHSLRQLWGFKYTSTQASKGIGLHADFARVNLNFWITPDAANLDPQSGGLVVYDVPAPLTWSFADYNTNQARIYAFLKEHRATARTVPHRCNRAVLFNSTLFHETDTIRFKDGYENRRVNVTYLFGHGLKA